MADTEKNIVRQKGRILYVEPNDIYGEINGVPMTPDYSDYCISVNLIAEVVSRVKQSGGESTSMLIATWIERPHSDENNETQNNENWISYLQGEDAKIYGGGKTNFLTTYYTDINYNDVVKKNIVEGLGIESIEVSFESFYTPTVVIKFVDVRGSSLFGREEVIHNPSEISEKQNSVFGAFFTIPYPKFKLQIKGFYGKGVTYQLTCSDFKASFNPNNGNFEAVVTFIGYSYSLLTDIPLSYIIAAPFCDYFGKDYWESHINTPEWQLSDGNPPVTLFDIIKNAKDLINKRDLLEQKVMSNEDGKTKNELNTKKNNLESISLSLNDFINSLTTQFSNKCVYVESGEDSVNEQLILFSDASDKQKKLTVSLNDNVVNAWKNLIKAFNLYNDSSDGEIFDTKLLPNGLTGECNELVFNEFCDITDKDITFKTYNGEQDVKGLTGTVLNNSIYPSVELAGKLVADASPENFKNNGKYFGEYAYIFEFSKFNDIISSRIERLNAESNEINRKIKLKVQETAGDLLGFTPRIGDIFKIIMCHLETFIHMMWECYRVIDDDGMNNRRTYEYLNVPKGSTDYPPNYNFKNGIGAWPGLFNNGFTDKQGGTIDEGSETIAWVGDFSHNFEEEKLVRSLYYGLQKNTKDLDTMNKSVSSIPLLPVMPNDINNFSDIFSNATKNDISSLSGYLSFRAAQIFGLLLDGNITEETANTLGKMDAFNYFAHVSSKADIKNHILNRASDRSLEDILYDISLCNSNADDCTNTYQGNDKRRHTFETAYSIDNEYNRNKRHPMLQEVDIYLKYVHYYLKTKDENRNKISVIPDTMEEFKDYSNVFEMRGSKNGTYFKLITDEDSSEKWTAKPFLHKSSSMTLFKSYLPDNINLNNINGRYINNDMFDIQTNRIIVDGVKEKYNELKTGTFILNGEEYTENLESVLNKIWNVSDSYYGSFFSDNMLSEGSGLNDDELYPDSNDSKDIKKAPKNPLETKWLKDKAVKFNTENGGWKSDSGDLDINNLVIKYFNSYISLGKGEYIRQNLFADPFYYLQNDNILKSGEDETKQKIRQKRVKGLLFLHTLSYDYSKIPAFLKHAKNSGGIYRIPYGYALLIGGLLWKKRYGETHSEENDSGTVRVDPIQTGNSVEQYYQKLHTDDTLFVKYGGKYVMCAFKTKQETTGHIKISELLGGEDGRCMPDNLVTNKLISLFLDFIDGPWSEIMNTLELRNRHSDGNIVRYTYNAFCKEAMNMKQYFNDLNKKTDFFITDGKKIPYNYYLIYRMINGQKYFDGFFDSYRFILVNSSFAQTKDARGILLLMDEKNTAFQQTLKDLYAKAVVVTDSSRFHHYYNDITNDNEITFTQSLFKSYLKGFAGKLSDIAEEKEAVPKNESIDFDTNLRRDLLLSIYLYLKTLWDRWLVSTGTKTKDGRTVTYTNYYDVGNFFSSFVFIDAFYRNIYKDFLINIETFKDIFEGRSDKSTLFQFIGDILKKHNCLFFALPDYVDMGAADNNTAIKELQNIFRPVPFVNKNEIAEENRFVIIYNPRLSETPMEFNSFKTDYFKIWNPAIVGEEKWDENLPGVFYHAAVSEGEDAVTRYGYYVPSFGIAFSKQGNHLFKSISLSTSSPLVTSASAAAVTNIAMNMSDNTNKVAFMGQDLYPVYSNYSYICEVEMMGDAQIQPFMYFQLMNVAMWSGVYMIFNVTHSITAGNMTTKFRGMKLSRNALPYSSTWFFYSPDRYDSNEANRYNGGSGSNNGSSGGGTASPGNTVPSALDSSRYVKFAGKLDKHNDHYDKEENYVKKDTYTTRYKTNSGNTVSTSLIMLYNTLYEEIKAMQEKTGGMKWNICISSVGTGSHVEGSQHYTGHAIDLQLSYKNGDGKMVPSSGENKKPDPNYFTVIDMIYELHFDEVYQVIYEQYHKGDCEHETKQYQPKCLHVGIKEPERNRTSVQFYVDNGNYGKWYFDSRVRLPEFKGTAKKYYMRNEKNFYSVFPNFQNMDVAALFTEEWYGKIEDSYEDNVEWIDDIDDDAIPKGYDLGNEYTGQFKSSEEGKKQFTVTLYNSYRRLGLNKRISIVLVAQDVDESGWGTSNLSRHSNYGGINNSRDCDKQNVMIDREQHQKAGYDNVGSYTSKKIAMLRRVYGDNITSNEKGVDLMRQLQGLNPKHKCYGGEKEDRFNYGVTILTKMVPSVHNRFNDIMPNMPKT